MNLTIDQTNAKEVLNEWLYRTIENPDDCFCRLTGSAGTGKTTLIGEFIKELQYPYKSRVCVSAPTHKARKIIKNKSKCGDSETVQSLLGLKPDVNIEAFDITDPIFSPIGTKKISNYKIIIIDESSMINTDLYQRIKEDSVQFKTKVLFIGDLKQLPPIEKDETSTFSKKVYIEVKSKSLLEPKNGYNLKEIVRQENTNPLIELLSVITNDIDNETNNYIKFLDDFPVKESIDEGYKVLRSNDEIISISLNLFKELEKTDNKDYIRYIAYTNETIKKFNSFIRKNLLKTEDHFIINESLLGYQSVPTENKLDFTLINSEDYYVKSVENFEHSTGILIQTLELVETDSGRKVNVNIVSPEEKNELKYLSIFQELLLTAKLRGGRFWNPFYMWKNSFLLMNNMYQGGKKVANKSIDYGYGITIHKSQGSTFDNVIINGKDINKNPNEFERKKLWYVALSRASKKAYIIL